MKVVWLSDLHMGFGHIDTEGRFLAALKERRAGVLIITGDTSTANYIRSDLKRVADAADCPVYFVLGNHDFYHGSIRLVRARVGSWGVEGQNLHYLPAVGPVALEGDTALVGCDGWYDGIYGDYWRSHVELNDFGLIADFSAADKRERLMIMRELAMESTRDLALHLNLTRAESRYRRVVVATHVPPFAEASWYEGKPSTSEALPFFASRVAGRILTEVAGAHPDTEFLVLCGHTHERHEVRIAQNLVVLTAGATYGQPEIQPEIGWFRR